MITTAHTAPMDAATLDEWKRDALADGWQEKPGGPWGHQAQPLQWDDTFGGLQQTGERRAGDRSVLLRKGDATVWLVQRTLADSLDVRACGWFDDGRTEWATFPPHYSAEAVEAVRGTCAACKSVGNPARLTLVPFDGRVCPTCTA